MGYSSLSFNGVRKPYLMVIGRKRRYWAPRELVLKENRTSGARLKKVKTKIRIEEVSVEIAENDRGLRKTAEDFAGWILTESAAELIFDDEPDRRFFAIVDGGFDAEEIVTHGYGTIQFVCPDSYKLGKLKELNITTASQTFDITGQTETSWKSKTTFKEKADKFELEADNSLYVRLDYDFIIGDVLTIDAVNRDIFLNGKDLATAVSLETEWNKGEFRSGDLVVKATHETTIYYDERYY